MLAEPDHPCRGRGDHRVGPRASERQEQIEEQDAEDGVPHANDEEAQLLAVGVIDVLGVGPQAYRMLRCATLSYTPSSRSIIIASEKRSATMSTARAPISRPRSGADSTSASAAASAGGSCGGTSSPVSSLMTASGMPSTACSRPADRRPSPRHNVGQALPSATKARRLRVGVRDGGRSRGATNATLRSTAPSSARGARLREVPCPRARASRRGPVRSPTSVSSVRWSFCSW